MTELAVRASTLIREIKKAKLSGKISSKRLLEDVNSKLISILGEGQFFLIPYDESYSFRFQILHDTRSVFSFGNKSIYQKSLKPEEISLCLSRVDLGKSDETLLVYSNYPREFPMLVTTVDSFARNVREIFDLFEEDITVLSSDFNGSIKLASDDVTTSQEVQLLIQGEGFLSEPAR